MSPFASLQDRLYFHVPYRDLLENLTQVLRNRVNCEIYIGSSALDAPAKREINLINESFKKEGLRKIMHGPFHDLNSGSFDTEVRRISERRYIQAIEFCSALGSGNIVMHTGYQPIFYYYAKDLWMQNALGCWEAVIKQAKKHGITICVENSVDTSADVIVELVKKAGSDNFKACFDIAHYNVFSKVPILESLNAYPPGLIREIHLSDNDGTSDAHLALGEGKIDFPAFFKELDTLGIAPIVTVEPHTPEDIPKSLAYLKGLGLM
ncbi:MAG: sugar phosphate isomerase/epimerase family protein [Candidatus Omnitrophota bacterium]